MAEEKIDILIDLKIDKGQTEKDIDSATKSIIDLVDQTKKLTDVNKDLEKQGQKNSQQYIDNTKEIEKNKEELNKTNAVRKELIKTLSIEENSLESVRKRNRDLTSEQQKLNLSTEDGRKRLVEINKELDKNNEFIKNNTSSLQQQKQNIGNYASALDGLIPGIGSATSGLESFTSGGSKLIPVIGGVSAGLSALTALYLSSAAGAKDLESAQTQLGTSFNTLGNNLAKLVGADGKGGGLLSALAFQLNQRLFGSVSAVSGIVASQAVQSLHEIELLELDSKRVAKSALDEAEKLRQIRDNTDKTNTERLDAAKKVQGFVDVREMAQVNVQKQKLDQLRTLLKLNEGDLELQKQIKEVEFEIADIREDSQGQRTEALNGILTLQREISTQSEIDRVNAIQTNEEELQRVSSRIDAKTLEVSVEGSLAQQQILINKKLNDTRTKNDKESLELYKKNQAAKDLLDKQQAASQLQGLNMLVNNTANAFGRQSKVFKAAATAQALINTYQGATAAFTSLAGIPYVGPALGIAAAAAAIIAGLKNVQQINAVQFAQGGSVNRLSNGVKWGTVGGRSHSAGGTKYYGEDGHTVELEKDEGWFVAKVGAHQKFLSGMSGLNQSEGGRSWFTGKPQFSNFALGGTVISPRSTGLDANSLAEIISSQQIVVTVEDINTGQARRAQVIDQATL